MAYSHDGSVRYDVEGPPLKPPFDERGQPLKMENRKLSVIRTKSFLAYTDDDPHDSAAFRREKAPENVRAWLNRLPSLMSQLDPWVFYAKNIRTDEPNLQAFCDKATAIQSAEGPGTILLRFRRGGDDARIELICDKMADCLSRSIGSGPSVTACCGFPGRTSRASGGKHAKSGFLHIRLQSATSARS